MSAAEALAPEQSASEVRESLSVTEKGQPANTIGNCRTVFCHDPLLRGAIRLNLLTDRVDIVRDLGWRRNTSALTDTDVKYLLLYFEQNYGLTSEKKMTAALSIVAARRLGIRYVPMTERWPPVSAGSLPSEPTQKRSQWWMDTRWFSVSGQNDMPMVALHWKST